MYTTNPAWHLAKEYETPGQLEPQLGGDMGIDNKYGRVTTEHGNIPEDEPVFLFRAKDILLPQILLAYFDLCDAEGSPHHHLDGIRKARANIREWQAKHFTQVPTSDSTQSK